MTSYNYLQVNLCIQTGMETTSNKQQLFQLENGITFSSTFESGNLCKVLVDTHPNYRLWLEPDPLSNYNSWFYFSVEGFTPGNTLTFTIVNMTNQVKLFKEGHLPVYSTQQDKGWARIPIPLQQNGVVKKEEGFQLTFKHTFNVKSKYYFAFSYPWTYSQSNQLITSYTEKFKEKYFCNYRPLCLTFKKVELNILTVTKVVQSNSVEVREVKGIEGFECFTFKNKKGIFVSARVHPGQVASSHILNGFIQYLFSSCQQVQLLLQRFVFYIVPMVNPDGVIEGNFRCDSQGNNLNRFYSDPHPQQQPQIYNIKTFLIDMINSKHINFCLDLHAHVNKQGAFIYGNSSSSLKEQVAVCLFPKLLQYNCRFFDYDACNFSQKNMCSKDKGDGLSKQGAARVAIYKDTGLPSCWTLECNYNSCKYSSIRLKAAEEEPTSKAVSNGTLAELNCTNKKQQQVFLNIKQFQQIGQNIAETILDYYRLRRTAPYFGGRLKNMTNFQLSLAISALRLIPFRFDNQSRKILNAINSCQSLNQNYGKILDKLGLDSVSQYMSSRSLKQKSASKNRETERVQSLKNIKDKEVALVIKRQVKSRSAMQKQKGEPKKLIIADVPRIPRIPKKK